MKKIKYKKKYYSFNPWLVRSSARHKSTKLYFLYRECFLTQQMDEPDMD